MKPHTTKSTKAEEGRSEEQERVPDTANVYLAGWTEAARAEAGYGKETRQQTIDRLTLAAPLSDAAKRELERMSKPKPKARQRR